MKWHRAFFFFRVHKVAHSCYLDLWLILVVVRLILQRVDNFTFNQSTDFTRTLKVAELTKPPLVYLNQGLEEMTETAPPPPPTPIWLQHCSVVWTATHFFSFTARSCRWEHKTAHVYSVGHCRLCHDCGSVVHTYFDVVNLHYVGTSCAVLR